MPRNAQPFYHRATILFTATREFSREELTEMLAKKLRGSGIVADTPECEEMEEPEAGDPADLL